MTATTAAPTVVVGGERLSLFAWFAGVDHKVVGALYLLGGFAFFVIGGIEALMMRLQLARPMATLLTPEQYDQLFTMHGTTMIFLAAVPLLLGFANYLLPLMLGAREVAFPRLNALSVWLFLFAGIFLNFSFLSAQAPDVGWFAYAPLTERAFSSHAGVDYWAGGMILLGASSVAGALNLAVTFLRLRCPGMSLTTAPMFAWMVFVQTTLILGALPALSGAALLLLIDRQLGAHFFDGRYQGAELIWQHLFWFFGHPEVYIVILPVFGMISEIVPVFARKPLFGFGALIASGIAIALLSFSVWAHHMFAAGISIPELTFFSAASMAIAVPTGVKVFNWLATLWGGTLRFRMPLVFALGFISMFVIGGLTGVSVAVVPFDWQATDTYYVVGHMHYVLFGGTILGLFAGLYYWFPKMTGRFLDERLGRVHFWALLVGMNLAFLPMHWLGLQGMPRRVWTYPNLGDWALWNLVETVGAVLIAVGLGALAVNVVRSLRHGVLAGPDPWDAWTLEWSVPSPPPPGNFAELPAVRSRRPLWDRKHPEAADPPRAPGDEAWLTRPRITTLAVLLFVASEAVFFGSVIVAYIASRPVAEAKALLDVPRTFVFSLFLFASSGTMVLADRSASRRGLWLLATLGLGAVFLTGQGLEWWRLLQADRLTPAASLFGSGFFTLTGLHGMHVLLGLIAIAVVTLLTRRVSAVRGQGAVEGVSVYWHFVDAVWVVIFSLVYLWTLLA
jgi:cytochrome c oxidase subunit 1/cytochrome c oxidase subunit I+III